MAQLALASRGFRAALTEADAVLAPLLGWSPLGRIEAGVTAEELAATDIAQPLLFAIQLALVPALAAHGITPAMVVGHSVGEVAAAFAAGLLTLPDAARLVVARSRHQQATRGIGRMAALNAPATEAESLLADGVEIAAYNAPNALTLAGPEAALEATRQAAEAQRFAFLPLDLDYAFHSAAMEPVRHALLADLATLRSTAPRLPMLSSVTGAALDGAAAEYWWRNLREPVRFEAAIRAALGLGARVFVEIGPNPVLQSYLRETARAAGVEASHLASLSKREAEGADPIAAAADRAVLAGADPRGAALFDGPAERRLPLTPFARKPFRQASTVEGARLADPRAEHPLLGMRVGQEPGTWTITLDTLTAPWLADHRLGADAVLPAAAMLEMALAAGHARSPDAPALEVSEFRILRPLLLEAERSREVRSTLEPEGAFRLESRPRLSPEPWTLHALGEVRTATRNALAAPALAVTGAAMPGDALRARAAALGLAYGPAFAAVESVEAGAEVARVRLARPAAAPADDGFLLHPSRLDGAMQGLFALLDPASLPPGTGLVPVKAGRLVVQPGAAPAVSAEIELTRRGSRSAVARLVLRDAANRVVARLEGATFGRVPLPGAADPIEAASRIEWVPAAEGPAPPPTCPPRSPPAAPPGPTCRKRRCCSKPMSPPPRRKPPCSARRRRPGPISPSSASPSSRMARPRPAPGSACCRRRRCRLRRKSGAACWPSIPNSPSTWPGSPKPRHACRKPCVAGTGPSPRPRLPALPSPGWRIRSPLPSPPSRHPGRRTGRCGFSKSAPPATRSPGRCWRRWRRSGVGCATSPPARPGPRCRRVPKPSPGTRGASRRRSPPIW